MTTKNKTNHKLLALAGAGLTLATITPRASIVNAAPTVYGTGASATTDTSLAVGEGSVSSDDDTTAVGENAKATAWEATAIGANSVASLDNALVVGANSVASGMASTALGNETTANEENTTAVGMKAFATKANATVVGTYAKGEGADTTAIGVESLAEKDFATAIGDGAKVTGESATGIGANINVSGTDSAAVGVLAQATADETSVFGFQAKATGERSTSIGSNSTALKEQATAIGSKAHSDGHNTVAIGYGANASMDSAVAIGATSSAIQKNTLAMGVKAEASAEKAVAIGSGSRATAKNSVAIGTDSIANEANTISVGGSFENKEITRRIVHVDAGVNDTDAVNVSQLKELEAKIQTSNSPAMDIDWSLINTAESTVSNAKQSTVLGGVDNLIDGNNNIVAGGNKNTVKGTDSGVFVGHDNVINAGSVNSAIIGGMTNIMDAGTENSVINGGRDNLIKAHDNAFIGGGRHNTVKDDNAAVLGGDDNLASEVDAVVVGGSHNTAEGTSSAVIAGDDNLAAGTNAATIGGKEISASGDDSVAIGGLKNNVKGAYAVIVGGSQNNVTGANSVALGGVGNTVEGYQSIVGGGSSNKAQGYSSVVLGGSENQTTISANNAIVLGGTYNTASGIESATVGGNDNVVSGTYTAAIGGTHNKATDSNAVVIGGNSNTASGQMSAAIGGAKTTAAGYAAIAMGGGQAMGDGSFSVGTDAQSEGAKAVSIGAGTRSMKESTVAIGSYARALSEGAIAIGSNSVADEENSVSVGSSEQTRKITHVTAGVNDTDAVNVSQLESSISKATSNFDAKLDNKANVSLDNINDDGKKVIEDIAKSVDTTAKVTTSDKNLQVTAKEDGNTTVYDVVMARDLNVDSVSVAGNTYINALGINANTQKITNAADGEVSKDSKDAVNGGQLYSVQQAIVNNVDSKLEDKANTDLDNITENGRTVIEDIAKGVDKTTKVEAGDNNVEVEKTEDGNTSIYTVKLAKDIQADSFGVGGKIYISADGLNANNQRITNVANGVNDNDAVNMAQLREVMRNSSGNPLTVEYDSMKKDVATLRGENGTTVTNVNDGKLSTDSKDAVNGSQLYATNQKVEQNATDIKNLRKDVDQNTEDIKHIRQNVESNTTTINQNSKDIKGLKDADKLSVKYSSEVKDEIVLGGNGGTTIKNVAAATHDDEAVNLKQLNDSINNVIVKGDKNAVRYTDDTHKKAVLDGADGTSLTGIADGVVAKDSRDAVNGGQLYSEEQARKNADKELDTRIGWLDSSDTYNVIHVGDSVSENLKALDGAINNSSLVKDDGKEITIAKNSSTKVINVADKNGESRVITGVQTNPNDGTSAANVDYVNNQTKKSQEYANSIGAQAAAMASLHPLDWDKNDKVSVAASVGAYKSEVAGAIGAYYRPDKKSMVSFQTSFGSNDNMFGIGISKKFGKNNPDDEEITQEEALALRNEVTELRTKNDSLEAKYQQLEAQNKKIIELLSSQNGLSATTVAAILNPTHGENTAVDSGSEAEVEA